ncbi:MAG: HD domain-containing protein [Archaeoglobaceae archaeon]|nr:HD domain-containing protein [Archaeoglobaceae archaeon]MDW8128418.1 HD domain-containing protein [Archaeoglobaceae archaeon]
MIEHRYFKLKPTAPVAHGYEHVQRVMKLAKFIAEREGANLEVVLKAVELHDLARDKENHALESAKLARKILREKGYSNDFIEAVAHAIEAHSYSAKIEPRTLEAKVLSDADKLDAIGAIGVARAFMVAGEKGRSIEETLKHFEEKLLKLKDLLYTETAKKLAEKRHEFLKQFYEEIKRELRLE